jgi:hypothetical protein
LEGALCSYKNNNEKERKVKMKKILVVFVVLALVLGTAIPALAQDVDTDATVAIGGGSLPIVKCKWETITTDLALDLDDDPGLAGCQILPPCSYEGTVPVYFWAVVTDEEDNGYVGQVYVDVYHPDGSFKYEVPMTRVDKFEMGIPMFKAAYEAGLITFGGAHTYDSVLFQLEKCVAEVWMGEATLSYHQPWGDYSVLAIAIDQNGNASPALPNTFHYIQVCAIEIDFSSVTFGSVQICKNKWVPGDTNFVLDDGYPTVRNLGNTDTYIWINQDDMGFGQDVTGKWNVHYDARMGNDPANGVLYDPSVDTMLPNALPKCNTDELDFSIHVEKGTSGQSYTGSMTIWCEAVP